MVKCKVCGGTCSETGNGKYMCDFCGEVFNKMDSAFDSEKRTRHAAERADSGVDVYDKNINGILEISCKTKKEAWVGSGYIISENGYAITNAHVAADDLGVPVQQMVVRICNREIPASVVSIGNYHNSKAENRVDLALIKLAHMPFEARALTFENVNNICNGEKVFVIGNSLGDGTCITSGIVSDKRRIRGGRELLMTDCAINGGNSGGPIFNQKGLVIGTICSSRIKRDGSDAQGMNYAVPVDIVQQFIEQAQKKLGIRI